MRGCDERILLIGDWFDVFMPEAQTFHVTFPCGCEGFIAAVGIYSYSNNINPEHIQVTAKVPPPL